MEVLLKLLEPNINVLKNRDGELAIKVECAIENIIRIYDEFNKKEEN